MLTLFLVVAVLGFVSALTSSSSSVSPHHSQLPTMEMVEENEATSKGPANDNTARNSRRIVDDGRQDNIVEKLVNHYRASSVSSSIYDGNNNETVGDDYGRRANVQIAPGYGKTLIALKTSMAMLDFAMTANTDPGAGSPSSSSSSSPRIILYCTPRLKLNDQVLEDADKFGILDGIPSHCRLLVGSKSNRTEQLTTSSAVIADFILTASSYDDDRVKFIVCTYKSLHQVGTAMDMIQKKETVQTLTNNQKIGIEFAIFDEAHNMEGIGTQNGYGLYDTNIHIHYRLFLTATARNYVPNPTRVTVFATKYRRSDGARQITPTTTTSTTNTTDVVRSFLDEELFGPCIERITQRQSVEQRRTVPIKLIVMEKTEIDAIRELQQQPSSNDDGHDFSYINGNDAVDDSPTTAVVKDDTLVPLAIQATFFKYNISKAVAFYSTNLRAKAAATVGYTTVLGRDGISVYNIAGDMSASKQEEILYDHELPVVRRRCGLSRIGTRCYGGRDNKFSGCTTTDRSC